MAKTDPVRHLPKQTVLVVDDNRINLRAISEALKDEYRIMAATSAEQALTAIHSAAPPDLVLLDVMMPDVDGFEICRRIKADPASSALPVIFVTAMDDRAEEAKGLALGAVDYITKPIVPAIVRARVKTHIELRMRTLALEAAYALIESQNARMEQELELGHELQMSLLPSLPEGRPEFAVAAATIPAHEVGGDFYDAFMIDAGHLCFCVGDVSGKGVPAALFQSMCQALVRSIAQECLSPAEILSRLNRRIAANNTSCMFVTMVLGVLCVDTGELVYSNAGHIAPLVIRKRSPMKLDGRHGTAIGVSDLDYTEQRVTLDVNDAILLYTDGVTEATNVDNDQFGEDRFLSHLAQSAVATPEALIDSSLEAIAAFERSVNQADDLTMLVLRFFGGVGSRRRHAFKLDLTSTATRASDLSRRLSLFLDTMPLDDEHNATLFLLLEELLSNTLKYGADPEDGVDINVSVDLRPDLAIIHISDNGIEFDPLSLQAPDVALSLDQRDPGGLGIFILRQLVDEFTWARRDGKNLLRFVKRFKAAT